MCVSAWDIVSLCVLTAYRYRSKRCHTCGPGHGREHSAGAGGRCLCFQPERCLRYLGGCKRSLGWHHYLLRCHRGEFLVACRGPAPSVPICASLLVLLPHLLTGAFGNIEVPRIVLACKSELEATVSPAHTLKTIQQYDTGLVEASAVTEQGKERIRKAFALVIKTISRPRGQFYLSIHYYVD